MKLFQGGCIHNEGYLKGDELQPKAVLGPEITRATASAIWAQKRRGLQLNPLQIPLVTDTAAMKQLSTGTYKLYPHWYFFVHERHLACFGPKNPMSEAI